MAAEFKFEQLDYPRVVYKGNDWKFIANDAEKAEALKNGWCLTEAEAKASEVKAADVKPDSSQAAVRPTTAK